MNKLAPQEFFYLQSPLFSTGEELLAYTFQGLCIRKVIEVEEKWVFVDSREEVQRLRKFFKRGINFNDATNALADKFFIDFFEEDKAYRLYHIRNLVLNKLNRKASLFKHDFVGTDLEDKKLCGLNYFPTAIGRNHRNIINDKIKYLDKVFENGDYEGEANAIKAAIDILGLNLVFLNTQSKQTIKLLGEEGQLKLNGVFDSIIALGFAFDNFSGFDIGSFDSISFDGNPSFDGFGGGGAGGDW